MYLKVDDRTVDRSGKKIPSTPQPTLTEAGEAFHGCQEAGEMLTRRGVIHFVESVLVNFVAEAGAEMVSCRIKVFLSSEEFHLKDTVEISLPVVVQGATVTRRTWAQSITDRVIVTLQDHLRRTEFMVRDLKSLVGRAEKFHTEAQKAQ